MKKYAAYKFFWIGAGARKPRRKTLEYYVINNSSGSTIGTIAWYGPWRQYCFMPEPGTVWSEGCLHDISEFIRLLKTGAVAEALSH